MTWYEYGTHLGGKASDSNPAPVSPISQVLEAQQLPDLQNKDVSQDIIVTLSDKRHCNLSVSLVAEKRKMLICNGSAIDNDSISTCMYVYI
jgi:hypothetical protein